MKGFSWIYLDVTCFMWTMLAVNLLNVLTCLPIAILAFNTDLAQTWPELALLSPLLGPSLAATWAAFGAYSRDGAAGITRVYLRGWRESLRRVLPVSAIGSVWATVIAVDVAACVHWGIGPLGLVGAAGIAVVTAVVFVTTWVALVEWPDVRRRDALQLSAYLAVRRTGWSAVSAVALSIGAVVLAAQPLLGVSVASAPVLYVVWASSRRVLGGVVGSSNPAEAEGAERPVRA